MIDGPETVQLNHIILQTKTQSKQIYRERERSLTKMDPRSTEYRGKTKEQVISLGPKFENHLNICQDKVAFSH